MFSQRNANVSKKDNFFFTIKSQGKIFSNYLAIISNTTLLFMPSIDTNITQQSSSLNVIKKDELPLIKKDELSLINIDTCDSIKTIKTGNNNTVFLASNACFSVHKTIYITDTEEEAKKLELNTLYFSFALLTFFSFAFAILFKENDDRYDSGLSQVYLILGSTSLFLTMIFKNLQYNEKITLSSNRITIRQDNDIFANIKMSNRYFPPPPYDNGIYQVIRKNVKVYMLYNSDYKVILPKYMKEEILKISAEDRKYEPSISVNIFQGTDSHDNIIFQFTNSHIEFSDKLDDCALLSLGPEIKFLKNVSTIHLLTKEPFPIQRNHCEEYLTLDQFPDAILPISCETTFDDQVDKINELTGHKIS